VALKELPDEGEVLYLRKELDGKILPAKIIPEHAEYGWAHYKAVERGLRNNDGKLPFRKQPRIPTFCETRHHYHFVSKTSVTAELPSITTQGQTRVRVVLPSSIQAAPWVVICVAM
jgi:hypothetical protein